MRAAVAEKINPRRVAESAPLTAVSSVETTARPLLILTIDNGAAHTRAAEAIAAAWREIEPQIPFKIVEVSEFMSRTARFTHVTAYLWLVRHAPRVWGKIDEYQKRQPQTSPEWFYRRHCRKIFDLARQIQPVAIVAAEVGCGEIAALIKRDLQLEIPLAAVSLDYEADRAWIQPETDFYVVASEKVAAEFIGFGASPEKIGAFGVPLHRDFTPDFDREKERAKVFGRLGLPDNNSLIVVAGGGEGLGKIREITARLLEIETPKSIVVLCGKNGRLYTDCQKLAVGSSDLRVLGWTEQVAEIYRAADLLVSKPGTTFDEAMACGLPIVALPPLPGAERAQYEMLEELGVGCAVETIDEAARTVENLLANPTKLARMRAQARNFSRSGAASKIAGWLSTKIVQSYE